VDKNDTQALVTQAAFLINTNYEMLILQLPDGRWQLPGGKLRRNEQWADGLRREIHEETNLSDVSILRVLYIDNWSTPLYDYYRAYFLCTSVEEKVYLSTAHINYQWITKETDLSQVVFTHETVQEHIKDFFSRLESGL